jgi:hypothetical protein
MFGKVLLGAMGGAMMCIGFVLCPADHDPAMDVLGSQHPNLWWLVLTGMVGLIGGGLWLILLTAFSTLPLEEKKPSAPAP